MNLNLRLANYITRYAPSRRRISSYLTKKKCEDISTKLAEIGYDEVLMIEMWMRTFVSSGKGEREMRMKLMKKEFPKILIDEKLLEFDIDIHDWEGNREPIERQISTLLARGKSRRMIFSLLIGKYPYFRDELEWVLEDQDDTAGLQKEVEKYLRKYDITNPNERQKFYAALLRKGFQYDKIKKMMNRENE